MLCLCAQLTDEERVFLNAAALGDVGLIRQQLEELEAQESEPEKAAGDVAPTTAGSSSTALQSASASASASQDKDKEKPRKFNVNCVDYMGRCE